MYLMLDRCAVWLQVNYSQCLGVIGYSLLPLTIIAAVLPVVHSSYVIGFCFKVLPYHFSLLFAKKVEFCINIVRVNCFYSESTLVHLVVVYYMNFTHNTVFSV